MRRIEQKIQEIYSTDLIKSPVHLSLGQELLAAVISEYITLEDRVIATYRGHALALVSQIIINQLSMNYLQKSQVFLVEGMAQCILAQIMELCHGQVQSLVLESLLLWGWRRLLRGKSFGQ